MKSLRPATFDIASGEFRDLVRRSREVVLLAAITGAITGLGVRFFEFFVTEVAFDRVLYGPLWFAAIAPGLGLVASAVTCYFDCCLPPAIFDVEVDSVVVEEVLEHGQIVLYLLQGTHV